MKKISRKDFIKTGLYLYAALKLSPLLGGCQIATEESQQVEPSEIKTPPTSIISEKTGDSLDLVISTGNNPKNLVSKAIEAIGGIDRFVKKGNNVVVKPNVLYAQKPEFAATTNPDIIEEIVSLCLKAGSREVVVLDRPTSGTGIAYKVTGIESATRRAGGRTKILSDRNFAEKKIPQGKILKSWSMVKDIFEADIFINVPIAKVHSLSVLTLSMKNLMGILGGFRSQIHLNFPQKIVDINTLVRPDLIVLDAYRILTRHGPTGGDLDDVELTKKVAVGTDPVKIDAWASGLFDLSPKDLPYLVEAHNRGLGDIDVSKYRIEEY